MVKYDADGNVKWAKSAGNISPYSLSVAVDASGFAFVTGYFTGSTITFGSHTLNTAGLFFVKYDINGNAIWAKGTVGASPNSVAVDTSGNIYMTGDMNGTSVIFDTITLTNPSLFIAKYNSDGNIVWAKSADGMNNSSPSSIALDISGNAYITGHYFGSITLGSTTLTNTNPGGTGAAYMFVAKYDTIGNVLWAKSAGGLNDTRASSVAVSVIGDAVYTTGSTYYTLSFGNNISYFDCNTIWNAGDYDIFLAKLDTNAGSGINLLINPTAISLFPNPTANYVTIENPNTTTKDFTLSITNIQGQQLLSEKVVIDKTHTIDLSKFPNGIYFLTLQNEKENYMSKVVVQR